MINKQDLSSELKKILPELKGLESKADGKLSKDEKEALEVARRNDNPLYEGTNIMPVDIENTKKLVVKIFDDIIKNRVNQKWEAMKESKNKANIDNSMQTGATKFVDAEREALRIIKAISAQMIDPDDVTYEDYRTTCAVFVEAGSKLCETILEPLKEIFGHLGIRSGYRSPELNKFGNEHRPHLIYL